MTVDLPALGGAEVFDVWSPEVGDTFRVFVGKCGTEPRVTLVVTDGNGLFGLTVDTVRLMQIPGLLPPMLIVAIGYPGADGVSDTIERRTRDLTPTYWEAFPGSGGADRFRDFIHQTLFDWIGARFPAALGSLLYFGHSLGGLFGTWLLLGDRSPFGQYILSSPSLFWDRYMVYDQEVRFGGPVGLKRGAFFGIGGLETDDGRRLEARDLPEGHPHKPRSTYLNMVDDLVRFTDQLGSRRHPALDLAVEVFPGQYHATVPGIVLTHGLRHFFSAR